MTHSFSVDDINDSADLALVLSIVNKDNTADLNKSSESLKSLREKEDEE